MGYETYLPTQQVLRQWTDRKKKLEVPVFPNYVFIKVHQVNRFGLLNVPQLVRFINFNGAPAVMKDCEIKSMQNALEGDFEICQKPVLEVGERVKVVGGQFNGLEGILVKRDRKSRLMVQFNAISRSVLVDIDSHYVEKLCQ
jgi:transcription antitermination factor NusG